MERFIKYAAIIIVVVIIKGYFGKPDSSGGDGLVPQTYRTPTIYNIPQKAIPVTSAAKILPELELPKLEMPKLEMPKITPPVAPNIDSLKAEIEATQFRLPELKISQVTE
ncbi:MAG: hypothetical protein J6B41_05880 [Alistipes sp.]|nr:hypothetical protein [Alistipes sp.]